jgi:hypothetical protein
MENRSQFELAPLLSRADAAEAIRSHDIAPPTATIAEPVKHKPLGRTPSCFVGTHSVNSGKVIGLSPSCKWVKT